MVGERVERWMERFRSNVHGIAGAVEHRATKGSPPLVNPSEDLGISPFVALGVKQERINRRRELLGLTIEPYNHR